jgi:tetratricopeptide (TPR) repeat protein
MNEFLLLLLVIIIALAALPPVRPFLTRTMSRLRSRLGRRPQPPARQTVIDGETGDEFPISDRLARPGWASRAQALARNRRLLAVLAVILIGALVFQRLPRVSAPQPEQFVVLVAPFQEPDGTVGQTGRSVAAQLVELLPEASSGRVLAQPLDEPPADASTALQILERENADVLLWGTITPGGILDQESLLPLLAYRPTGTFAPAGWEGYTGRFALSSVYALANAPINGQAVLPGLLGALADYGAGRVDSAFTTLGTLVDEYPALNPALPRALRSLMLWARGEYEQAAGEERRALAASATGQAIPSTQALLANNLGAILQDAGDPAARDAFAQAVALLAGNDLGALHYNLGIAALRAGQPADAVRALEQARQQLPASTPLLLTLSEAYRLNGQLDQAHQALTTALQQVRSDAATTTPDLQELNTIRLRAATLEQQALLRLAQLVQARGPLLWEVQASPPLPAESLDAIRGDLAQAIQATEELVQGWSRRALAEDATDRPIAGQVAIEQSRRAEGQFRARQRWQALVEIESGRAGGRARSGILGFLAGLLGDRSPLGQARQRLADLLASHPDDVDASILLGRALAISGDLPAAARQLEAAANTAPQRPEPLYEQALVALPTDRQRARALLTQAIARNAQYFPARQKLAEIAEADHEWAVAIEQHRWLARARPGPANTLALARALRLGGPAGYAEAERALLPLANQDHVPALIELGRLYLAHGDRAAAREMLERAQRIAPRDPVVAYELGQVLAAEGDLAGARAQYQRAVDADPANIQAHLELAQLASDSSEAAAHYQAALEAGASDPAVLKQIGRVLLAHGDARSAIGAGERAIEAAPNDPEAHHGLAQAYLQAGRLDAAQEQEQRALELKGGTYPEALVGLGDIALRRGNTQEAVQRYNAALEQNPALTAASIGLGRAHAAEGRWSVAQAHFQNAAARDPNSAEAQLWLGEALIRQNNASDAITAYSRAIALKPDYAEAYFGLAQAQLAAGQAAAAQASLDQALRQRPAYPEALLLQGKLYEQRGDEDRALEAYSRAIAAGDQLAEPRYRRALLFIRRDRMGDAERDLEAAVRIQPNFSEAHYWLGRTYLAQGRAQAAREQFEQAVAQRDGNYPEALFYQGIAEEQLGQPGAAAAAYRAALEQAPGSSWADEAQAALARLGQP